MKSYRELSGWILPDGKWHETPEWWHISAVYDMMEAGSPFLKGSEIKAILKKGDEGETREALSALGFAKISRGQLDAESLTPKQLETFQDLIEDFDPDEEIEFLSTTNGPVWHITIARILKTKNPKALFKKP